ncbi:MAG: inositol monophosphatase, partial [Deltaproteobacteria bacterium]|nr:inositol monophosphatase [Deltaproteobacteria bacterium]
HICYVAMGRAEAALLANESYEGLAASLVIIEAAGGEMRRMDGRRFFFNERLDGQKIEDHILATAPETFQEIRDCLNRVS